MSEATTGVKWEKFGSENGFIYTGNGFIVRLRDANWYKWAKVDIVVDIYAADHATAKQQAERWILEREGRLPAPATDGGGWIACSDRMPEKDGIAVEVRMKAHLRINKEWWVYGDHTITHWRPLRVDPHAVAACLFGDERPTLGQARAAALHVAGCEACRAKLEAKGGA